MRTDRASSTDEASPEPGFWRRAEADADTISVGRDVLISLNAVRLSHQPQVTVIVPTRTVENGLGRVLDQLGPMVARLGAEIIFVVDGHNGSFDSLVTTARTCPVPVRALCRRRGPRPGDRSSAVLEGARHARGTWVLVLNAGPQHPPAVAAVLAEAASYVRSYQAFENSNQSTVPSAADTPLYERIAQLQLEGLLEDSLNGAQLKYDATASTVRALISPVSTLDAQLQQQSGDFSQSMDQLVLLLRTLKQMGFDDLQSWVTQCTRDMAGDALQSVNALTAASRLYEPEQSPAGTAGDGGGTLFALGPAAQTGDYLTRQLQRAQVLAGYASPFVSFLLNTEGIDDARRSNGETADYWSNTITEINRYVQFKEPNGQVAHLNGLFLDQLAGMTQDNCADRLDKYHAPVYGNDLFSQRRAALERQSGLLCNDRAEANAFATYEGVAAEFNRLLAGHYPFGAPYRQEASLAAVKAFFTTYLKQRDALHAELNGLKGDADNRAQQFLTQLDSVADFMAASLAAGDVSHALTLKFNFRSYPSQSPGSDQLVTWKFASGDDTVSFPNGGDQVPWQFGEPVALTFDWANQSRFWPQPDPRQEDLLVDKRSAQFSDGGQWALLRLIQAHLPRSRPITDPLDTNAVVLQFTVPVRVHGSDQAAGRKQMSHMYLSLHLSGVDASGAKQVPVKFPLVFPQYAPTVW